ncbi:MAG TPA: ABC transporter substrate-binding protein [Actinomycetota bacterium]|nr:ABC transporter substrate-binding protein [Actinomycetota bacterium]
MGKGTRMWWVAFLVAVGLTAAACGGQAADDQAGPPPADGESPAVETLEAGVLTVGMDVPYPPFEFREGGEVVGLDVDLANEIADRLGLQAEFIDTDFDTIFTQLAAGRFDVVVSATTITPEREQEVNFTQPYYRAQQTLAVQAGSDITGVDDLGAEHVVAVQRGTTGELWAEQNVAPQGVQLRTFVQTPDLYTALEAGQVDGVINDEPNALQEIEAREGLEIVETIDTGENYGIAVNPANEALLEEVDRILGEIIEDGTYEQIYSKYEDLPPGGSVVAAS